MLLHGISTLSPFNTRCFSVLSLYANGYDTGKIRVKYGDTTGLHSWCLILIWAKYYTIYRGEIVVDLLIEMNAKRIFPYI